VGRALVRIEAKGAQFFEQKAAKEAKISVWNLGWQLRGRVSALNTQF
jgi:hypothetical protein